MDKAEQRHLDRIEKKTFHLSNLMPDDWVDGSSPAFQRIVDEFQLFASTPSADTIFHHHPRLEAWHSTDSEYQLDMPFYTFGQWWQNPGKHVAEYQRANSYAHWLMATQELVAELEERGVLVRFLAGANILCPSAHQGAILTEIQPVSDLVVVNREPEEREPEVMILTIYSNSRDELLCAVAITQDEAGIIAQREYFPFSLLGMEHLFTDAHQWAEDLDLPVAAVEIDGVEFCECCGDLTGMSFHDGEDDEDDE